PGQLPKAVEGVPPVPEQPVPAEAHREGRSGRPHGPQVLLLQLQPQLGLRGRGGLRKCQLDPFQREDHAPRAIVSASECVEDPEVAPENGVLVLSELRGFGRQPLEVRLQPSLDEAAEDGDADEHSVRDYLSI
ncbi:hypothetical protein CDAR_376771, partial [Caerostris darwini]